jgi:hypothetical protein
MIIFPVFFVSLQLWLTDNIVKKQDDVENTNETSTNDTDVANQQINTKEEFK